MERAAFSYARDLNASSPTTERRSRYSFRTASTCSLARGMPSIVGGSGRAEQPEQQGLLRVQAVLGLVPNARVRPVDDLVGDLLAPVGREAVQHQDIRSGPVYGLLIEPVGREHQAPIGGLLFLSHAGPDVGVQHVGSGRRRLRVAEQRRPSPGPGGD